MADYPKVDVGGYSALASNQAPWSLVPGVRAPVQEFDLRPDDAKQLLTGEARTFTLKFDTGATLEVRNLVAISKGVSKDPNLTRVRVTDQRYGWPYLHIGPSRYNMRRKIGVKLLENAQSVREVSQVVDSIAYHPASLNSGTKWTALGVLRDILDRVAKAQGARPGGKVFGDGTGSAAIILPGIESLPLEDFVVDDSADNAIARILAYLPGAAITVDADGGVRVYSEIDGSEKKLVEDSGPESVGLHVEAIDNSRRRPRQIDVLFEREAEVRFNYTEGSTTHTDDERYMENVLQIPDYSLDLGGGNIVTSGTWVEVSTALAAWNTNSPLPQFGNVTLDFIRRAMVPYMDPWKGIGLAGASTPDADWLARFAAILTHYRQTYRINPKWIDRIRHIGAYRVATVDRATGTRGKAVCWADYSWIGTQRAGLISHQSGQPMPYAMNIARYPTDGLIGPNTPPAVADVELLDADQGIVRFAFRGDVMRVYEQVLPSQIAAVGTTVVPGNQAAFPGPLAQITGAGSAPFTFDSVRAGGAANALTAQYKAATILTAFPAYPNSEAQLHRVIVKPSDVKSAMPEAFRGQLEKCYGPTLEIKIGADIETARMAWLDAKAELIEQAFGVSSPKGDITQALEEITLNSKPQQSIGDSAASLQAIAHAAAAAAWASYADHWEGSKEVPMNGALKLQGFAASITHVVESDGRAVTRIELRGPRLGLNMFAYLDKNTRALVMRLART